MFIIDDNIRYDDDKQLFGVYVGKDDMSLWFTVWGISEDVARIRGEFIVKVLNGDN